MTLGLLLAAVSLSPSVAVFSDGPSPKAKNVNYVGNRAPLIGTPFLKLPVGNIEPKGWLLEYLKRQRSGLTGNLGKISAWLDKTDNAWLSKEGKGKWGWEEVPYWLKGYGNLGYIRRDKTMIAETMVWINGVLSSQRADGNFGPTAVDEKGAEDFWPKMLMLYCLQSYFEHSHDQRVLSFMTKFFRYELGYPEDKFLQQYWQSRRSGDNLHSVIWLYNITGESFLVDLAEKLHRKGLDWKPRSVAAANWFKSMPDWHNVNIAQGFREPTEYYQLSHSESDRQGSYKAFNKVREYFGQVPGGMFGSDENARPGYSDPRQGVETCGMVEQMNSDEELLRITGDPFWADHAEEVAFNTYPAAVMPDFRSLRYITSPNMVLNDDKDHHPGIANSGPFLMMNPFSSRCCQHNHSQGWPYYVENLWQATSDNGLAAVLYGASTVTAKVSNGVPVQVISTTHYPFNEAIEFRIKLERPTRFPLYFRVPGWSHKIILLVGGKEVDVVGKRAGYIRVEQVWKDDDRLSLRLPMELSVKRWTRNHNSVSVNLGPLTYSLKIGEQYVQKSSVETAIGDSKWQPGADAKAWPSFEIHPTTPWNYGLLLQGFEIKRKPWPADDFPFTQANVPISIWTKAKRIPVWKIDEYGLCGTLMDSPVRSNQPVEKVELIPMGAARLRISAFPVIHG